MASNPAGKLMIIQQEISGAPGTWENLCGINDTTFNLTNAVSSEVRVPCADRSQVVETIKTYGEQGVTFDVSGLFDSDAKGVVALEAARTQTKKKLRVFVPEYGYFEYAEWLIPTITLTGGPTNSLNFSGTFESSGTLTFTAI